MFEIFKICHHHVISDIFEVALFFIKVRYLVQVSWQKKVKVTDWDQGFFEIKDLGLIFF